MGNDWGRILIAFHLKLMLNYDWGRILIAFHLKLMLNSEEKKSFCLFCFMVEAQPALSVLHLLCYGTVNFRCRNV